MPVSEVMTGCAFGIASPRSVTVTPGSVPPDSSMTFPEISPVVRCAYAGAIATASINATTNDHTRVMHPPASSDGPAENSMMSVSACGHLARGFASP